MSISAHKPSRPILKASGHAKPSPVGPDMNKAPGLFMVGACMTGPRDLAVGLLAAPRSKA